MTELAGKTIGRYDIKEKLGEGGMATVYKSFDNQTKRSVAIKLLRNDKGISEKFLKRFQREAKTLAKLNHAHIIPVIDHGDYEGIPYLVMPYLQGGTLKKLLGKPIPYAKAATKLEVVADALAYAHDHGVIHRDVKPTNILLDDNSQPFLSDFGIAKIIDTEETSELTGTGIGMGTPEYISPEQALGKHVDGRTDCYSLGIVFYEMVTGRKPFTADTPLALAIKQATDPLPNPRQFIATLPEKVELVLLKALAKDPDKRYQSMHDFAADLHELASGNLPVISSARASESVSTAANRKRMRQGGGQKKSGKKWVWVISSLFALVAIGAITLYLTKPAWVSGLMNASTPTQVVDGGVLISETPSSGLKNFRACYIAAIADDITPQSFSGIGWAGVQRAVETYGITSEVKTPTRLDELSGILAEFIQEGCSIIISSEFNEVELMQFYAKETPEVYFAMNECDSAGKLKNARCAQFETKYAALLAGFLACGYSPRGAVGTFGGGDYANINDPMQGFGKGVEFYNFMMEKECRMVGWDSTDSTGTYIYNTVYGEKAKNVTQNLLVQGADVIFPVAKSASQGALAAVTENGNAYVIGVDSNWADLYPESQPYIVGSIVSHIDDFVYDSIERAIQKNDFSSFYVANLENNEVEFIVGTNNGTANNATMIMEGLEKAKNMIALAKNLNIDPLAISYEQLQIFLSMQLTPKP